MKEIILEAEHLSFSYEEEKKTLKDVSVKIYKGERIAVLGANGAGKSTFFLMLNGVRTPEEGSICINGTGVTKKNRNLLRKKVGIVFQDADQQLVASTVKAEVAFGPMNMKLPKDEVERRTLAAMEKLNLTGYAARPPHYLSGGEKKRVSIADILAMDSEVIIFDEPTASLDPINVRILEEVLEALEQEEKTILLSTHDIDFAYRFADRILVFSEGRLIGDGTPDEIFSKKELLAQANLMRPAIMEVCDLLRKRGYLKEGKGYPKNLKELDSNFV